MDRGNVALQLFDLYKKKRYIFFFYNTFGPISAIFHEFVHCTSHTIEKTFSNFLIGRYLEQMFTLQNGVNKLSESNAK